LHGRKAQDLNSLSRTIDCPHEQSTHLRLLSQNMHVRYYLHASIPSACCGACGPTAAAGLCWGVRVARGRKLMFACFCVSDSTGLLASCSHQLYFGKNRRFCGGSWSRYFWHPTCSTSEVWPLKARVFASFCIHYLPCPGPRRRYARSSVPSKKRSPRAAGLV